MPKLNACYWNFSAGINLERVWIILGVRQIVIVHAHKLVRGENLQESKQTNKGTKQSKVFNPAYSTSTNASNRKQPTKICANSLQDK